MSFLLITSTVYGEVMTFEKETEEIVANDQSREQVEAFALQKVKRLAVEEAGTYISSLSVVLNNQLQKDEITALASGVVQARVVGLPRVTMENGVIHVKVAARIQVDTSILDKQVAELLKEKGTLQKLEDEQRKVRVLEEKLSSLKSTELKRLEELNVQAAALDQERERRRMANAEMALKAQGALKQAEIARLQKDRELQEQTTKILAQQEQQRKTEADGIAKEQDRVSRAQLENDQRWNDLARKSQLAQQQWVDIDDSLSMKQALEEVKSIRGEIGTLKQRSEFQYDESVKTLKAAYALQITAASASLPPPLSEKDAFESTAEYNKRRSAYEEKVKAAKEMSAANVNTLEAEENRKIAQAKNDYLKQKISLLKPFVERLQTLQARKFVLPNEPVAVDLGVPDADRNSFPVTLTNKEKRWTAAWEYTDRTVARDIYSTRSFLKAEALAQLSEGAAEGYAITEVRVTHPGTGQQKKLSVELPSEFSEILAFRVAQKDELSRAENEIGKAEGGIQRACLNRKDNDINGYRFCGDVALDLATGLIWTKNSNVADKEMNWNNAMTWVKTLSVGGYHDWRLPTKEELNSLVNRAGENPGKYFSKLGFTNVSYGFFGKFYWTSSTGNCREFKCAWSVSMNNGFGDDGPKSIGSLVWAVRRDDGK